ncbi:hypothetical protein KC361_g177 [Hortaea werneckii]|nr:hypothetical protein KC361_g177 [Hortaea werneckii]
MDPGILTAPLATGVSMEDNRGSRQQNRHATPVVCWDAGVTLARDPNRIRINLFPHLTVGMYVGYTCNIYIATCVLRVFPLSKGEVNFSHARVDLVLPRPELWPALMPLRSRRNVPNLPCGRLLSSRQYMNLS